MNFLVGTFFRAESTLQFIKKRGSIFRGDEVLSLEDSTSVSEEQAPVNTMSRIISLYFPRQIDLVMQMFSICGRCSGDHWQESSSVSLRLSQRDACTIVPSYTKSSRLYAAVP